MPDSALACHSVSYAYRDGTLANDSIDLSLSAGEIFCLLGPNGAGKTTLIRQITADLIPSSGSIEILGQDAHVDPAYTKSRLGIVPQSASLFDGLKVEEHLRIFAQLKGLSRAAALASCEKELEECDLLEIRNKRIRSLSGGQQRKVMLALALLGDPRILILDEPSLGLDPEARRMLWLKLERLRDEGRAILLTTHYLDEAQRLADRLGLIESAVLGHVGTLDELYAELGKSVRLAEVDPDTGSELAQHYFDSVAEAQGFARDLDLEAYAIGRVSLEDIYLRLVGHRLEAGPASVHSGQS